MSLDNKKMSSINRGRLIWILLPGVGLGIFAVVGQFALRVMHIAPEFLLTPFETPIFWLKHLIGPAHGWTYYAPFSVDQPFQWVDEVLFYGEVALVWFCLET